MEITLPSHRNGQKGKGSEDDWMVEERKFEEVGKKEEACGKEEEQEGEKPDMKSGSEIEGQKSPMADGATEKEGGGEKSSVENASDVGGLSEARRVIIRAPVSNVREKECRDNSSKLAVGGNDGVGDAGRSSGADTRGPTNILGEIGGLENNCRDSFGPRTSGLKDKNLKEKRAVHSGAQNSIPSQNSVDSIKVLLDKVRTQGDKEIRKKEEKGNRSRTQASKEEKSKARKSENRVIGNGRMSFQYFKKLARNKKKNKKIKMVKSREGHNSTKTKSNGERGSSGRTSISSEIRGVNVEEGLEEFGTKIGVEWQTTTVVESGQMEGN